MKLKNIFLLALLTTVSNTYSASFYGSGRSMYGDPLLMRGYVFVHHPMRTLVAPVPQAIVNHGHLPIPMILWAPLGHAVQPKGQKK